MGGYLVIEHYLDSSFQKVVFGNVGWEKHALIGTSYGLLVGIVGWKIVQQPLLKRTKSFFRNLIRPIHLNIWDISFISLCAGVGEEIFFRGAIQPILGIWPTALIFVAIHGYFNPKNLPLTLYGVFMTFAVAGFGFLTLHIGLLSAMISHAVVDIILLSALAKNKFYKNFFTWV